MSNVPSPGLRNQPQLRGTFRIAGAILTPLGLALFVIGFMSLISASDDPFAGDSFGPPKTVFLMFLGLPVVAVGAWCLQAGFMGVAARYAAGEGAPVIKDSAAYLTDGQGILGVGRTVDDPENKFCTSCGKPAPEAARFCESCGHAYA
jgi:zinc ribbon protein